MKLLLPILLLLLAGCASPHARPTQDRRDSQIQEPAMINLRLPAGQKITEVELKDAIKEEL